MTTFFNNDTKHGFVKRHILRRYCAAFVGKTQNYKKFEMQTIIYDAFAGAGYYGADLPIKETKYGSPLICLDVVSKHFKIKTLPECSKRIPEYKYSIPYIKDDIQMPESESKVILNFSEANKGNCLKLVNNIILFLNTLDAEFILDHDRSDGVITIRGDDEDFPFCINIACTKFIHVKPPKDKRLRRLLTFIDPFGYRQIPMKHVQRFIGEHREALVNFMSSYVNRFKNVKKNEAAISELYGFSDEETRERLKELRVSSNKDDDGIDRCLHMYEKELKKRAESRFTLTFAISDKRNIRRYHLTFITNHIKGFKAMKEAMNSGSQDANSLSMSDYKVEKNGMQLSLGNKQDKYLVAAHIYRMFKGKENVKLSDIEDFIWFKTPYVWRKKPLKILQKEPNEDPRLTKVRDEDGKKPKKQYTYPDGTKWLLTFRT